MKLIENKNKDVAISQATRLATLDPILSKLPFHRSMTLIAAPIVHNQYCFVEKEGVVVSFCGWGLLSPDMAAMLTNDIRPLTLSEFKSGQLAYVTTYASPFDQKGAEVLNFVLNNATGLKDIGSLILLESQIGVSKCLTK